MQTTFVLSQILVKLIIRYGKTVLWY